MNKPSKPVKRGKQIKTRFKSGKKAKTRVVSKSPKEEDRQEGFILQVDKKTKAKARLRKAKKRFQREKFKKTTIALTRGEKSGQFGRKDQK